MLDALLPFVEELERRVADGEPWQDAWRGGRRRRHRRRARDRGHAAEGRPGAAARRTQRRHARRGRDLAGDVRTHRRGLLHPHRKGRQLTATRAADRRRLRRRRIRVQGGAQGRPARRRSRRRGHRRRCRHRRGHRVPACRGGGGPAGRRGQGRPGAAGVRHRSGRGDQRQQGAGNPCGHRARQLLGRAVGAVEQRPGACASASASSGLNWRGGWPANGWATSSIPKASAGKVEAIEQYEPAAP